jgi:hypothetical protein
MAGMAYDELVARLTLQNANIGTYSGDVGATPAEIADIAADLANLETANELADVVDGGKKTVFQIKQAVFNGDDKFAIPDYPPFPAGVLPNPAQKPGAYQRYIERGKRWKTAAGWTSEIGTALGYDGPSVKPDPATVKPTIELFAAASNHHFSIVVSNRGEANMWDVYILRKAGSWTKVDSASGKSADIHISPTQDGDAEQIQVRVQLRKANEDYGIVSDPVYVTVNP